MRLEQQVQICIGEATGTPMLEGHDFARLRFESVADLATSRAIFEGLMRPSCLLDRRNVFLGIVVARTIATMQRIENSKLRLPRKIVIWIDHEECSDLLVICLFCHATSNVCGHLNR